MKSSNYFHKRMEWVSLYDEKKLAGGEGLAPSTFLGRYRNALLLS